MEIRRSNSINDEWLPPPSSSTIRQGHPLPIPANGCSQADDDDIKFRKVRGILNKLTPENFDKLTTGLVQLGLDSPVLLKGVILLIFEKASQEPKFVSMYAQLCKRLSEKVPNFDFEIPPSSTSTSTSTKTTTTFLRLLLSKCQDEYENRARTSAIYDDKKKGPIPLSEEEEEEKLLAKRKMLGNIQFIGELGKLEMLPHSILHKCCEQLLKKSKKAEDDLECLV